MVLHFPQSTWPYCSYYLTQRFSSKAQNVFLELKTPILRSQKKKKMDTTYLFEEKLSIEMGRNCFLGHVFYLSLWLLSLALILNI